MSKFFATMPYPYQNGTLHLGHAYTFARTDFATRFKKLQGYNTLLPFAFHLTGIPICASAKKLADDLEKYKDVAFEQIPENSQIKIMLSMGIPKDEINKFVDPYYWGVYFPQRAKEDIIAFGGDVDFSRSFVTTDINPYYDSFVTWQFNILIKKGYVTFGKRYVIYSEKDGQPCADHDRAVGETIEPVSYKLYPYIIADDKFGQITLLCTVSQDDSNNNHTIFYNPAEKFQLFSYNNVVYCCREFSVRNLGRQIEGIKIIESNVDLNKLNNSNKFKPCKSNKGSGIYISSNTVFTEPEPVKEQKESIPFKYYEPNGKVISRSNDECIVALTDQWFINYGSPDLKEKVNSYLEETFTSPDKQVVEQLKITSNWINDWPCSRSYGLGTKLPNTDFLIDSLSDSTIYMAFYTISHLITKIDKSKLSNSLWDFIFLNGEMPENMSDEDIKVMMEMKYQFKYWYPLDLRVSGKDLVPNHLTMCLYNHAAIWEKDMYPRSYLINGHIMLNGEKMSKNTGNFITMRDAINKFGPSATRLALSDGDGLDDANFSVEYANVCMNKLANEAEWICNMIDTIKIVLKSEQKQKELSFWDKVFDNQINMCNHNAYNAFTESRFRKAITDGFYQMLRCRDQYLNMSSNNINDFNTCVIKKFVDTLLIMIYPICPKWVTDICEKTEYNLVLKWNEPDNIDYRLTYCSDLINNAATLCNKSKNKKITVFKKFSESENQVFDIYKTKNNQSWNEFMSKTLKTVDKKNVGNYGKFLKYIDSQVEKYSIQWLEFVKDENLEFELYNTWISKLINKPVTIEFGTNTAFKNGPAYPNIN